MEPLEFEMDGPRNGDDGRAIADRGGGGDRAMGRGYAVDLLAAVDLVECHGAENRREDHSRSMDVDEVFMPFDATTRGLVGDFGSADGVVRGRAVHGDGCPAKGDMNVARCGVAVVAVLRRSADSADAGRRDGDDGDETEPLMDLQHVGPPIQERLALGAPLRVCGGKPEVAEG